MYVHILACILRVLAYLCTAVSVEAAHPSRELRSSQLAALCIVTCIRSTCIRSTCIRLAEDTLLALV